MLFSAIQPVFIVFLLAAESSGLTDREIIDGFFDISAAGPSCSLFDEHPHEQILLIINNKYGYGCYGDESGREMHFSSCIVQRTDNNFTSITDRDIAKMVSLKGYSGAADKEMWEICDSIVTNWNTVPKGGINPLTVEWDVALGDYPLGIFDVVVKESPPDTIEKFRYKSCNFRDSAEWDYPGGPDSTILDGFECTDEPLYFVQGSELYGCVRTFLLPEFFGCVSGSLGRHRDEETGKTIDYVSFDGSNDDEILRNIKMIYSYVGFKSTSRPMDIEIKNMNRKQLCARLSAEPSFINLLDDPEIPDSHRVFTFDSVEGTVQYYPKFKWS